VEDLTLGAGREAAAGDTVRIHYVGMLANGTSFDSSRNREPLKATLGRSMLIPGFDRGVQGMRVGGRRRITVPPELGYGKEGQPPRIPGSSTLVFEVELMEIQDYAPPKPSGAPGGPGGPGTPPPISGGRMQR
jgi:FKBP-type peptidyl-prolyl cis-trans isomerase